MRRRRSASALTTFVTHAPTSSYEEDNDAFYFNAKIGPRRMSEELHTGTHALQWNEIGERLSEFIMATKVTQGELAVLEALLATMDV
ncbi:hypothetical protein NECAME_13936 [Necator americanus]|uniref:Uncharacterized protein n=1 Tax=Necator americanus TaxID=51031 RepID=W2SU34_NECAM|nr:hypothetical protein NECAME_13936 [Necator americanus]ETN72212.1 hypothetical protein NECAME_13936 [Necator americanus]